MDIDQDGVLSHLVNSSATRFLPSAVSAYRALVDPSLRTYPLYRRINWGCGTPMCFPSNGVSLFVHGRGRFIHIPLETAWFNANRKVKISAVVSPSVRGSLTDESDENIYAP